MLVFLISERRTITAQVKVSDPSINVKPILVILSIVNGEIAI